MASKKSKSKKKKKKESSGSWLGNNPFTPLTNTDAAWSPPSGLAQPTQMAVPTLGGASYVAPGAVNPIGQAWEWQGSPELQALGAQLGGMSGTLAAGPQNAFSAEQMAGLKARAMGKLQQENRNFATGLAQSNAGRGIVGNTLGGMMQGQLDARRMGSLANAELDTELAGMAQGTLDYNAKNSAFGNMGQLYSGEQSRRFDAQLTDRNERSKQAQNAFSVYQNDNQAALDWYNKYAPQMIDKPESGNDGKYNLAGYRQMWLNLRDKASQSQNAYQQYLGGQQLRPRPSGGGSNTTL